MEDRPPPRVEAVATLPSRQRPPRNHQPGLAAAREVGRDGRALSSGSAEVPDVDAVTVGSAASSTAFRPARVSLKPSIDSGAAKEPKEPQFCIVLPVSRVHWPRRGQEVRCPQVDGHREGRPVESPGVFRHHRLLPLGCRRPVGYPNGWLHTRHRTQRIDRQTYKGVWIFFKGKMFRVGDE